MALRNIRVIGDNILNKTAREVNEMTPKILTLIGDMLDTMYDAEGVGLAAPQVGILKRIIVVDISLEGNEPIILINPVLIENDGEQTGSEGCLSVPGKVGMVTRPNYVKVKGLNEKMEEVILEGREFLARALCHEINHLDGKLYVEMVEGELLDTSSLEDEE